MKICISIPVHERLDVVVDQIHNIKYFYDHEVCIVLHLSQNFHHHEHVPHRDYDIYNKHNVFVNHERLPTSLPNTLVHVHNSNFKFAKQHVDFDYFVLHASNDMYVKKGAKHYIERSKNAAFQFYVFPELPWCWVPYIYADNEFREMTNHLGISTIYGSQPEGMFFQKHIFEEMVKVIDKFYIYGRGQIYPREEVYYPTLASKFVSNLKSPHVFSEVLTNKSIDPDFIRKINCGQQIENYGYPYDNENLYAVKRIHRDFDHPNRQFIRSLMV